MAVKQVVVVVVVYYLTVATTTVAATRNLYTADARRAATRDAGCAPMRAMVASVCISPS